VDLSSHWLACGTECNRWALTRPLSEPIGDKNPCFDGPEKGRFDWSRKKTGKKCKGVLGREPTCKGVSHRHAFGDEGAEVVKGSQNFRVEAGECPERAYFAP
jgi:hypothetical protein